MPGPNLAAVQSVTAIDPPVIVSLSVGDNTIYTSPVAKSTRLDKLVLTNVTTNPATVSVSIVPPGGTASAANRVGVVGFVIPPRDALTIEEIQGWIPSGVSISVNTPVAATVVAKLTGLEFA